MAMTGPVTLQVALTQQHGALCQHSLLRRHFGKGANFLTPCLLLFVTCDAKTHLVQVQNFLIAKQPRCEVESILYIVASHRRDPGSA